MLSLTYLILALGGCGYILIAAFLGHLFDFSDAGHGGHAGDHGGHAHGSDHNAYGVVRGGHGKVSASEGGLADFHFPFFSPLALATLLAALGSFGLIAKFGFKTGDGASLLIALPAALATAYVVTYAGWRIVQGSRASSVIRVDDLSGTRGEVTTPIPVGGLGEVVAMVRGQRYASSARAADGREIPRGAAVVVTGMVGSTLLVQIDGPKEG